MANTTDSSAATRTETLIKTYLFRGKRYGPGTAIVPGDFPAVSGGRLARHAEKAATVKTRAALTPTAEGAEGAETPTKPEKAATAKKGGGRKRGKKSE